MDHNTVTTAPVGNVKKVGAPKINVPKAKHWAGCTLNNYTAQDEAKFIVLIQPLADYYVYGREVGDSGTPHLQFMVCFKKQTSLTACLKIHKCHWEVKSSKSTMVEASDYCKKVHSFDYLFVYTNVY